MPKILVHTHFQKRVVSSDYCIVINTNPVQYANMGTHRLNKQEAVSVLKEILYTCRDNISVDWVSLDPLGTSVSGSPDSDGGYLVKMKVGLDHYSCEKINLILEKHGLVVKEERLSWLFPKPVSNSLLNRNRALKRNE